MCSHVLSMLVCGLHGHCAVSRCALRVFMGSVFTCALRVCQCVLSMLVCGLHGRCAVSGCVHGFCVHVCSPCVRVCSTCVHVCYLCSRVLSVCVLSVEAGLTLVCSLAQTSPQAAGLHPPTLDTTTTWSGSDNHLAVVPPVFTPLFLLSSYKSTF